MDDDILCPICLSVFTRAVDASCGHSFCAACLQSHLLTSDACPVCRHPIDVVHPSFTLRKLADAWRQREGGCGDSVETTTTASTPPSAPKAVDLHQDEERARQIDEELRRRRPVAEPHVSPSGIVPTDTAVTIHFDEVPLRVVAWTWLIFAFFMTGWVFADTQIDIFGLSWSDFSILSGTAATLLLLLSMRQRN